MRSAFLSRLDRRREELEALYHDLYPEQSEALEALLSLLRKRWQSRSLALKERDRSREQRPDWYRGSDLLGMCLYVDQFAGTALPDSQIVITDRKIVEALLDENGAVAVETETVQNHRLIKSLEIKRPESEEVSNE